MRTTRLGAVVLGACAGCTAPAPDRVDNQPASAIAGEPNDVAARLLGPRSDLELASRHTSLVGEHLRYRRIAADGTRILDREVSVHLDGTRAKWSRSKVLDDHPAPFQLVGDRRITEATAGERARAVVPSGRVERVSIEAAALPSKLDRDAVRAGYRAIVETVEPAHGWEIWVDGDGTAELVRDLYKFADGTGLVYDPNPLAQTGDVALVDNNDATSAALDAARFTVTLPRLDGTGILKGQFADVKGKGARAQSANLMFAFTRADDQFEEVNTYYHLDATQAKLQALGFTMANNRVQVANVNANNQDNSFYSPMSKEISFGTGGVDDAEDADVVVHEYGHSIQDNIVPGFGASDEAGAMGEGFGDLLAASVLPADATHVLVTPRECVATWDATVYDTRMPPCLRRLDGTKHWPENASGEVHDDGEIWSAGVWDFYKALGDPAQGLKLVVQSFFAVAPDATFASWSEALIAADVSLNGGANASKIKQALWARGLYRIPEAPGMFDGTPSQMPADLGPASPIPVSTDDSLTINHPGAGAIRVHFSTFEMEEDAQCLGGKCDNVYVFDGAGTLYGILGGALGPGDGPIVPGDTVVIRWVTDSSVPSMGFHIDRYDFGGGANQDDAGASVDDGGIGGPEAGVDPGGDGDGGGCCDSGRTDAGSVVGLAGFAWIIRRRRRPAR